MKKPDLNAKYIHKRFEEMRSDRAQMETLYAEVAKYIFDQSGNMHSGDQRGVKGTRAKSNYSKVGVKALIRLAAALQGFVAPQEQRWFSLVTSTPPQRLSYEARLYLDLLEDSLFHLFASSNFYQQSLEMITDYAGYGRGAMFIAPDPINKIRFVTVPMRETYIDTDFSNRVDTVCRHFGLSRRAVYQEFAEDGMLPGSFTQYLFDKGDEQIELIHYVSTNPHFVPGSTRPSERRYVSIYLCMDKPEFIARKSFFNSMPYVTPRWTVLPGEKDGRSQAMFAVQDVRMLSAAKNDMLGGLQLLMNPPWLVNKDSFAGGIMNRAPGGAIPIQGAPGGDVRNVISPLQNGARPDIGLQAMEVFEQNINEMFFADILQESKNAEMSATEASTRQMLRIANMAPQLGRLLPEYLVPLIPRVIEILIDSGHVPPFPDELQGLTIEFRSPLAKAQKRQELDGLVQFGQFIAQWGAGANDPTFGDRIDNDQVIQIAANATDIPTRSLKSDERVAQEREMREQQLVQERQLEAVQGTAQAQANLATAADKLAG